MSDENSSDSQEYKEPYYHEEDDVEEHRDKVPKYEYGFQGEDAEELHYEWVAGDDDEKEEEEEEEEMEESGETERKEKNGKEKRKVVIKEPDSGTKSQRPSELPEERGRRKTIYELDAYAHVEELTQNVPSVMDAEEFLTKKKKKSKRISDAMGISDVARVNLSPLTQKIVGCVIDENVTTEFPWIYAKKEIIEDDLDLHSESSDFLPIKSEVEQYPAPKMLIGYAPKGRTIEDDDEGQFYVCLTVEGRDAVVRRIEAQRAEQLVRVRMAVEKTVGSWQSQGSEDIVDLSHLRKSRPLFEIEVEDDDIGYIEDIVALYDNIYYCYGIHADSEDFDRRT